MTERRQGDATSGRITALLIKPSVFVPPSKVRVYWQCHQVSYSIHPTQMRVGMHIAYCDLALREFARDEIPPAASFIKGRVTKIDGDMMTITFDRAPAKSITCGLDTYSRFCIPIGKP
jgi:hypothetical protein